jgi:hypothetical protein
MARKKAQARQAKPKAPKDDGAPGPAPKDNADLTPKQKAAKLAEEGICSNDLADYKLALDDATEHGNVVANRQAGKRMRNLIHGAPVSESITFVVSYKPDGIAYLTRGKHSRNYPIVVPSPFNELLANQMEVYLGYNYVVDEHT